MAQTYTFTTTTRRMEVALAYVAKRAGQSVEDYLRDRVRDAVNDAITQFNAVRPAELAAAYANATPEARAAVDAALGLP